MLTGEVATATPLSSSEVSGKTVESSRFLPLDAFRGLIMILLVSDGLGFEHLVQNPRYHAIAVQFDHSVWVGTTFYDLIAPAFLFMVGMSVRSQRHHGRQPT